MRFDEIGYWSELKLEIVRKYAAAYAKILAAQKSAAFHRVYIDGFCGPGVHITKRTRRLVKGSPLNALSVDPPFHEYFLVDLDGDKVENLRRLVGDRSDVHLFCGDCNKVLLEEVFPKVRWEEYRRGLCLLDPYGLHLDWRVIEAAGKLKSIDLFLNFPIMDINRNALWRSPERTDPADAERMTAFWGDDSWRSVAWRTTKQTNLFSADAEVEKVGNDEVAEAFRQRLQEKAGFRHVPPPIPMRNSTRAVVYYLFFASQNEKGEKIATGIFAKYRTRGS